MSDYEAALKAGVNFSGIAVPKSIDPPFPEGTKISSRVGIEL